MLCLGQLLPVLSKVTVTRDGMRQQAAREKVFFRKMEGTSQRRNSNAIELLRYMTLIQLPIQMKQAAGCMFVPDNCTLLLENVVAI